MKLIKDVLVGVILVAAAAVFPLHATEHVHHMLALLILAAYVPVTFALGFRSRLRERRREQKHQQRQSSGLSAYR